MLRRENNGILGAVSQIRFSAMPRFQIPPTRTKYASAESQNSHRLLSCTFGIRISQLNLRDMALAAVRESVTLPLCGISHKRKRETVVSTQRKRLYIASIAAPGTQDIPMR